MTSLKFGTSGLRGLVADLVGGPAGLWCLAFLRSGVSEPAEGRARQLLVGRDLRGSSPAIAAECRNAARAAGFEPVDCGAVPTPALALASLARGMPAVMVTGSHIPDDRNGLKFYRADGEITKADENAIRAAAGHLSQEEACASTGDAASLDILGTYEARYLDFFGSSALEGLTVGVYQHSSVARDVLMRILASLGATPVELGRATVFVPVDTEAHRPEDVEAVREWGASERFDAIVSTDGDGDRPLIADGSGRFMRGDVAGLLTARHLGLSTIVTPVTSSSAIERTGIVETVIRTRVGSPFVIAGMAKAVAAGQAGVIGFEANGGVLLGSDVARDSRVLSALPTRDAVLPIVAVLAESVRLQRSLADVVRALGAGHAAAHRLAHVEPDAAEAFLKRLGGEYGFADAFFADVGPIKSFDRVDGVRVGLESGAMVHFRASGNAPELRCYAEGADEAEARAHLEWGLGAAERALGAR